MSVTVSLPRALTALFPEADTIVTLDVRDVSELMDALDARWPGMRAKLCDTTPAIRPHMSVFVDGVRASLSTPLTSAREVFVMTRISGG